MKRIHSLATAALVGLILAAPAAAQDSNTFRWQGDLAAGRTVTVRGIHGEITASPSTGGRVEVTAVKSGRRGDPAAVRIEVRETADGVTICPVYPDHSACPGDDRGRRSRDRDDDVKVDTVT